MRALRRIEAPRGLDLGDQVGSTFADDAGFSAALLPVLDVAGARTMARAAGVLAPTEEAVPA